METRVKQLGCFLMLLFSCLVVYLFVIRMPELLGNYKTLYVFEQWKVKGFFDWDLAFKHRGHYYDILVSITAIVVFFFGGVLPCVKKFVKNDFKGRAQ